MGKIAAGAALILCLLHITTPAYTQPGPADPSRHSTAPDTRDSEMRDRIDCFARLVNSVMDKSAAAEQLEPFLMNDEDIDYWMGQFEFTEAVRKELSPEQFRERLEGWAELAEFNFRSAMQDADRIEVTDQRFRYGDDPKLRVSRSANLRIRLLSEEADIGWLHVTMIDVRGQLKLLQVN